MSVLASPGICCSETLSDIQPWPDQQCAPLLMPSGPTVAPAVKLPSSNGLPYLLDVTTATPMPPDVASIKTLLTKLP